MKKELLMIALAVGVSNSAVAANDTLSPYVDAKGNISFPTDFRTNMVHLGSWFVPEGGASGFHDVYAEKSAVEAYRKDGKFPDGTTLVKELRASDTGDYTTGQGVSHSTGELKQWFVMVKDSKNRFTGNDSWGDGWGWALFPANDTSVNTSSNYKVDCLGCHVPAKDTDWIYTEAYPILSEK